MKPIQVFRLGQLPYGQALALQLKLRQEVYESDIPGFVLLLQHPPVITLGKRGKLEDIYNAKKLGEIGAQLFRIDRGGEATYHCPGQLIVYPILSLPRVNLGVVDLVRGLSKALAETVQGLSGLKIHYDTDLPGLWTDETPSRKMASVGMRVSSKVSTHGAAINLSSDLKPFSYFAACGMAHSPMTRLNDYGDAVDVRIFEDQFLENFQSLFEIPFVAGECTLPPSEDWIQPDLKF